MKKFLCLLAVVLCAAVSFCACQLRDNEVPPSIFPYLKVELNKREFTLDEEVTITASIGFPQWELDIVNSKVVFIISKNKDINVGEENVYILKTITDFAPYVCDTVDGKTIYKSTEDYVVPQSIFNDSSSRFFYCTLCWTSVDDEDWSRLGSNMQYTVIYSKDEDGITLYPNTVNGLCSK